MRDQAVLKDILQAHLATDTAAAWEAELIAAGVPAGPVLSAAQIAGHPRMRKCGQLQTVHVPALRGTCGWCGPDITWAGGKAVRIAAPPPVPGQDTGAVLREAGFSETEIEALRADGVPERGDVADEDGWVQEECLKRSASRPTDTLPSLPAPAPAVTSTSTPPLSATEPSLASGARAK
jgi:hypothetical protein